MRAERDYVRESALLLAEQQREACNECFAALPPRYRPYLRTATLKVSAMHAYKTVNFFANLAQKRFFFISNYLHSFLEIAKAFRLSEDPNRHPSGFCSLSLSIFVLGRRYICRFAYRVQNERTIALFLLGTTVCGE